MAEPTGVLARVEHVLCKKQGMGALLAFENRIVWQCDSDGHLQLSFPYDQVKCQKISPAGKDRVQLQLCMQDGSSWTVQFCNPEGLQRQLQDRDKVKELLQVLLAKSRRLAPADLAQKQKALQSNPGLLKLYEDLVTGSIMKAEEFWSTFAADLIKKEKVEQKLGVSGGFLGDVVRNDVYNEIKFNLTPDIMESIFNTYPMVKKKHDLFVPSKMEEGEFWFQFFNSQYFHRDRSQAPGLKEFFSDCIDSENEGLKAQLQHYMNEDAETCVVGTSRSLFEEFAVDPDEDSSRRDMLNKGLVNRLNYHSNQVIRSHGASDSGCQDKQLSIIHNPASPPVAKKSRQIMTNGLQATDGFKIPLANLNIDGGSKKFQTFIPDGSIELSNDQTAAWLKEISDSVNEWCSTDKHSMFDENVAFNFVLRTFSMDCTNESSKLPLEDGHFKQLINEVRDVHFVLMEVLRHFWSLFPPVTAEAEQKIAAAVETLQKYESGRLQTVSEHVVSSGRSPNFFGLEEMWTSLKTAYSKYENWKLKRAR